MSTTHTVRVLSIGMYDIKSGTGSYHVKVDNQGNPLYLTSVLSNSNANRLAIQGLIEGVKAVSEKSKIVLVSDRQIGLKHSSGLNQDKLDELFSLLERNGHEYEFEFNKGRGREVRNEIHRSKPQSPFTRFVPCDGPSPS